MKKIIDDAISSVNQIILGKDHQVKLTFACLIAKGHLLVEDLPGMGKTTLAQALAKVIGLDFNRIQFTSDLLPSDIIGVTIFDKESGQFEFRKGPIFGQVILADEINRATPKAQGALLEAMEEQQVTVEGQTYELPKPFFVLATQNPNTQMGTFPLPEAQLDRFLMRVSLGYPDPVAEREIILGKDRRVLLEGMKPIISVPDLFKLQLVIQEIHVSDALLDYIQRMVHFTRTNSGFTYGLSPRATIALVKCSKAWAYIAGRDHVIPEDVQAVLPPVVEHRLRGSVDHSGHEGTGLANRILTEVDVIRSE